MIISESPSIMTEWRPNSKATEMALTVAKASTSSEDCGRQTFYAITRPDGVTLIYKLLYSKIFSIPSINKKNNNDFDDLVTYTVVMGWNQQ